MGLRKLLGLDDDRIFLRNTGVVLILMFGLAGGTQTYLMERYTREPKTPRYEDVNGDGIEDKVVEKKYRRPGIFWSINSTIEEVLYGTGTDLNGKKLYLPKELFEEYKR